MTVSIAAFAFIVCLFFAFIAAALIRSALHHAHKQENGLLVFLHAFWIVVIVVFASNVPVIFG